MLRIDPPSIDLDSCTSQEFSESDNSFEVEFHEFTEYTEDNLVPPPDMRHPQSFYANKLTSSVKLSKGDQISELEKKLTEKENEVLLAADIGQVLLKEIDSLKYRIAAYEHSRLADDLSQEIKIKHNETVQMLRSFRIEAEIYTSSFREKSSTIAERPYSPGRRSESLRILSPFSPHENRPERSISPLPTLDLNRCPSSTLYSEINRAVESGENVMKLSRQIQTKLLEAERESLNLAEKCSEQERQIIALKTHMTRGTENEAKIQENSWNLELQNQELQTQVASLEQVVQKSTTDQINLRKSLLSAREVIEQLYAKDERSNQTVDRIRTKYEQQITEFRKLIANLQKEKAELNRRREELKSKPTRKDEIESLDSPGSAISRVAYSIDSSDISELPPSHIPSPLLFTVVTDQTLQVETLAGSLRHAHRTIANLRSLLHKAKLEKFQVSKVLAETQRMVEDLKNVSACENREPDKWTSNPLESDKNRIRYKDRHRESICEKSARFGWIVSGSNGDLNECNKDKAKDAKKLSITTKDNMPGLIPNLNEIVAELDQSIDSHQSSCLQPPTKNSLTSRSMFNPIPSCDLLDGSTSFDKLSNVEELKVVEQQKLDNGIIVRKNQEIQVSSLKSYDIYGACDSSVIQTPFITQSNDGMVERATGVNNLKIPEEKTSKSSVEADGICLNEMIIKERTPPHVVEPIQHLEVGVQTSEILPVQCPKSDASTQTINIPSSHTLHESSGRLSTTPTRPTTQPPPALITLSLSPIQVDRSSLKSCDRVGSEENPDTYFGFLNQRRSSISPATHPEAISVSETLQFDQSEIWENRHSPNRGSNAKHKLNITDQATYISMSDPSTVNPSPQISTSRPMGSDTLSSFVIDSSFADEESWLDHRRIFSADPAIIHAITQAMIGSFMFKYTRRVLGTGISERKHIRYFWIHPHAKTINWSVTRPGPDRVMHHGGQKSKSAYIKSVRVIKDVSSEINTTELGLVIQTTTRELKIKPLGREKHDLWLLALTYLQSRQNAITPITQRNSLFNVTHQETLQTQYYPSTPSTTQSSFTASSEGLSKKRSLAKLFRKPSKSILSSPIDIEKDNGTIDDVRKCCNGRHDIARLDPKGTHLTS